MTSWIGLSLGLLILNAPPKETTNKAKESIGKRVFDLTFVNDKGKPAGLSDFRAAPALVLVIMGRDCPVANALIPDFNDLQREHPQVPVLGIYMGPNDAPDLVAMHVKAFAIEFPVLVDREQACLEALGAKRTGETFVLDGRRVIRYHGRIGNRVGYRQVKDKADRADLALALEEVLAGKKVSVATTPVEGCLITDRHTPVKAGVDYCKDIAPILHAKCAPCHHPGTAAPFSLLSYKDAAEHAAMIQEVIQERRMPPWFADARHGHFLNNRALSAREIRTISNWVQSGHKEGNPAEAPVEPVYSPQWNIGKPDQILRMPTTYKVPASGPVKYQFFYTKTKFQKDMWIQKAEVRPGNRAAVHHLIVSWRYPGSKDPPEWIAASIPGGDPTIFPEGMARRIPAGVELVWQVHYNATGKVEEDQSEIGFVFSDRPPRKQVLLHGLVNNSFVIPPGAPHHEVTAQLGVARDLYILGFFPHMHSRGRDFEYRVAYPDGRSEVLLSIPRYDSNWQATYRLKQPKRIPAGSVLRCIAHYDNSAANPANPNPKKEVVWGEQAWEEMFIGYLDYYLADGF